MYWCCDRPRARTAARAPCLTDAIDRYMASHPHNDRPKAFAVGQTPQAMSKQNSGGFVLWQQKQVVKPANVKRIGVLSENSIISHANEPLAHHGAVCGTITEVTGTTVGDDVGVFDVCHNEVTSGHSVDTAEATTLTDGPVFINESASTEVIDSSSANSGSGAASDASSCVSRVAGGSAVIGDDVISEAQRSDQLFDTCVTTTVSANELSPLKYVKCSSSERRYERKQSSICFV